MSNYPRHFRLQYANSHKSDMERSYAADNAGAFTRELQPGTVSSRVLSAAYSSLLMLMRDSAFPRSSYKTAIVCRAGDAARSI